MAYTNKLCLVLLLTRHEYLSGLANKCLDAYFNKDTRSDFKIDVHVYINNGNNSDYADLLHLQLHRNVENLFIKCHNLKGLDDLYARSPSELSALKLECMPELGGSAGPNNLFFNTMIPLMDGTYKDYLMIESDTQPLRNDWIDKIISYGNDQKFMIAGSTYKGSQGLPLYEAWTGHLNGVAIYRRSKFLKSFMYLSRETIKYKVTTDKNHFISFDVGMHNFLGTLTGKKYFDNPSIPENHLIDSPIISNFSLPIDAQTSTVSVLEQYPGTIILHKKWN